MRLLPGLKRCLKSPIDISVEISYCFKVTLFTYTPILVKVGTIVQM